VEEVWEYVEVNFCGAEWVRGVLGGVWGLVVAGNGFLKSV